jgi:hypothetical protein
MMGCLDWLAGVFSSSGSVGQYKSRPTVSICRRDIELLRTVQNRFGFGVIHTQKRANAMLMIYKTGPRKGQSDETPSTFMGEWKALDHEAVLAMMLLLKSDFLIPNLRQKIERQLDWLKRDEL